MNVKTFLDRAYWITRRIHPGILEHRDLLVAWHVADVRYRELCKVASPDHGALTWQSPTRLAMFGYPVLRDHSRDDPDLLQLVVTDRRDPLPATSRQENP